MERSKPHSVSDLSAAILNKLEEKRSDPNQDITLQSEVLSALEAAVNIPSSNTFDTLTAIIKHIYWDALLRRIDEHGLERIFNDPKMIATERIVYVPHDDPESKDFYSDLAARRGDLNFRVEALPPDITPEYIRALNDRPGILSLGLERDPQGSLQARPFVVPGGRFNEMYGWDSFFTALGLIEDDRVELAKSMCDNFIYQIEHYGRILNANRTYYLSRSQPPLFVPMAQAVLEAMDGGKLWESPNQRQAWIERVCIAAIKEYRGVWTASDHVSSESGLAHYFDRAAGFCPEVEPGHYNSVVAPYCEKLGISPEEYIRKFNAGKIENNELKDFVMHDRAMRESGHDTSYRMLNCAATLNPVDLNSLLVVMESGIARLLREQMEGEVKLPDGSKVSSEEFEKAAQRRTKTMQHLNWDEKLRGFFDFDPQKNATTGYVSASSFFALFAGIASDEQARVFVASILPKLEHKGGLSGSDEASRGEIRADRPLRQWDFPFGWAPHIMVACAGLARYGFQAESERLAYKWLFMVMQESVRHHGAVVERYDVVNGCVFEGAEYGAQGLLSPIDGGAGFAWTNASVRVLVKYLSPEKLTHLRESLNPEAVGIN